MISKQWAVVTSFLTFTAGAMAYEAIVEHRPLSAVMCVVMLILYGATIYLEGKR